MSTASTSEVTAIEGAPTAGVWALDPAHSTIGFTIRHLLSKVRGGFTEFSGTLTVAVPPEQSVVEGAVKTASITTNQAQRDEHLRTSEFFDAATYPELTFRSTSLERTGDATANLTGDLTIKGVTRPVVFAVEYLGVAVDPFGNTKAAFSGTTKIDREDWGLNWNAALESGGFLVGKEVTIDADVQFVQQAPPQA